MTPPDLVEKGFKLFDACKEVDFSYLTYSFTENENNLFVTFEYDENGKFKKTIVELNETLLSGVKTLTDVLLLKSFL